MNLPPLMGAVMPMLKMQKLGNDTIQDNSNTGKKICKKLRAARMAFAKENGIDFHPVECHSDEPCVGTCPQCDSELEYLKEEAKKKKIVLYPEVEISSIDIK